MIITVIVTISKENPQDEEGHTHTNTRINTDTHTETKGFAFMHTLSKCLKALCTPFSFDLFELKALFFLFCPNI